MGTSAVDHHWVPEISQRLVQDASSSTVVVLGKNGMRCHVGAWHHLVNWAKEGRWRWGGWCLRKEREREKERGERGRGGEGEEEGEGEGEGEEEVIEEALIQV